MLRRHTGRLDTTRAAARPSHRRLFAAVIAVAAINAAPAGAQTSVTLTFDALTAVDMSGVRPVPNCYVESAVRITVVGEPCGLPAVDQPSALATYTPDNISYTGTPALFNNLGTMVDFTPVVGGPFSFGSIDLAPVVLDASPLPMGFLAVTFTGLRMGGMSTTETFQLNLDMLALQRFTPMMDFTNLSSLRMEMGGPDFSVQFDNVNANVVPEPSTYVLMATGLAGLAALRRRRAKTLA